MSRKIEDLTPALQPLAREFLRRCEEANIRVIITQTLRTAAEQQAFYDQGRTTNGKIVTNAKPGQSKHETGEAFDVAFMVPVGSGLGPPYDVTWEGPWERIGAIGESLGLEWGGRWRGLSDRPHFQMPKTSSPSTLRRGDSTATVSLLQRNLHTLGFYAAQIGELFGPRTEKGVRDFQAQEGLVVDGIAGAITLERLRERLAELEAKEGRP